MDYDKENSGIGSIPEFGAIFMSNTLTKKECFKRNVFALPSSMAKFVEHVKAGMVLFLFEFEKRQLFGVFRASCDGAMDIVPHGFNYSGKRFPAQVRFTPIWCCNPLSEKEFKDAIRENYFSPKKFNFGLSEAQVRRLMVLFSSRKLTTMLSPQMMREVADKADVEDRGCVGDASLALSERAGLHPSTLCDYQGSSLNRATVDELLQKDAASSEGKVYPVAMGLLADPHGAFLSERKRVNYEDDSYMSNEPNNEIFNDWCTSRSLCIDPPAHSLDEVRRSVDGRRLLTVDMVYNDNQVDNDLNHVPASKYPVSPLGVRTSDYDRFMQRNRFSDSDLGNAYGQAFESEHYGKTLNKNRHAIDRQGFLIDDSVRREYNVHDIARTVELGDGKQNLYAQTRDSVDDHQYLISGEMENRYHLHSDGPVSLSEQFRSPQHKLRKITAGSRFPINDRIEGEPDFGTCSMAGFSSENFAHRLHCDHRTMYDGKLPMEGRGTENMVDSIRSSATLNKNSRYIASADEQVDDFGRFRMSGREENFECVNTFDRPVGSNNSFFSKLKQKMSSSSNKSFSETGLSRFSVSQNFDHSHLQFDDSTITRAVPYIPELPAIAHGSSSLVADWNSSSVPEKHPYHGSGRNLYSLSESLSSPSPLEPHKSNKSLDVALEYVNNFSSANLSSQQSALYHKNTGPFISSNLSMNRAPNISAPPVEYRDSSFSLPPVRSDGDNIEEENRMFAYPSRSSENNLSHDGLASQHVSEYVPRNLMDMSADKDFICSEAKDFTRGDYHRERGLPSYDDQAFRFSGNMDLKEHHKICEAPHSDSKISRKSVFTRLTSGRDGQVDEERKDPSFNCYDKYMAASADEVMEMLQQGNNLPLRKKRELKVVGRLKHVESALEEKHSQGYSGISRSTMEKKKLKDTYPATTESNDETFVETRIVDFKRRSETKKSLMGTTTDPVEADNNNTHRGEVATPSKKILKRKKLVRPVFEKLESAGEGQGNDQKLQQLSSLIHDKDDKQNCQKDISVCKVNMANDKVTNLLDSHSHQLFDGNTNEDSNCKEEKNLGAHLLPSLSDHHEGHRMINVGLQTGSLQVFCKETTEPKGISPQTSTSILSKEIGSTVESLKLKESSSGGLKLDAVSENPREEKRLNILRRKKKLIRTSKTGTECSK